MMILKLPWLMERASKSRVPGMMEGLEQLAGRGISFLGLLSLIVF